ncbi:MAG: hypothetical protein JWO38_3149 [Gemmataceae bacterium]|nr:hypothetical protein [Gemmataceae bacterium]
MDLPIGSPLGAMTFIVAPAILTNASSIMALGTSNRFALAVDRARVLAAEAEGRRTVDAHEAALRLQHLMAAEGRVRFLVRALTAFYLSAGMFAAAWLLSLFGALAFEVHWELLRPVAFGVGLCIGVGGVGCLITGCGLLVWETRITLRVLAGETAFREQDHRRRTDAEDESAGAGSRRQSAGTGPTSS